MSQVTLQNYSNHRLYGAEVICFWGYGRMQAPFMNSGPAWRVLDRIWNPYKIALNYQLLLLQLKHECRR